MSVATLHATWLATDFGPFFVATDEEGHLVRASFSPKKYAPGKLRGARIRWNDEPCRPAVAQLQEYFAGRRRSFDLPIALHGTPFQAEVWRALQHLPFGTTTSYSALAADIGRPTASRAVGRANGLNPLAVVIPCHRVLGADGSLTGFAGGTHIKAGLLALEGVSL
ncbi:MAG: methylated-DNA--[protein]-cysteine S-methyltransferase [Acidobacteriota bacterium]